MLRLSLVLMLFMGSPARAGYVSGNMLYESCNSNNLEEAFCIGYIAGVSDVMHTGDDILGLKTCFPPNVPTGQLKDVVIRWLETHPKDRHYSAEGLSAIALSEAFPCS